MSLPAVVPCAGGLSVAQRGASWVGPRPTLHVAPVAPVGLPEQPPREALLPDGVVWRRHWPGADRLVVEFVNLGVGEVDHASGAVTFDRELPADLEQHLLLDHLLPLVLARLGFCVVHGAVISSDDMAAVLVGSTGAGKSTLAAYAGLHGWDIGGDDGAVFLPTDPPTVEPTYATVRLSPDAATVLGIDTTRASDVAGKVRISEVAGRRFRQERLELGVVAFVEPAPAGAEVAFERLGPIDAHAGLLAATFHHDWSDDAWPATVLEPLAAAVEAGPVGRLHVPRGPTGLAEADAWLRGILTKRRGRRAR